MFVVQKASPPGRFLVRAGQSVGKDNKKKRQSKVAMVEVFE